MAEDNAYRCLIIGLILVQIADKDLKQKNEISKKMETDGQMNMKTDGKYCNYNISACSDGFSSYPNIITHVLSSRISLEFSFDSVYRISKTPAGNTGHQSTLQPRPTGRRPFLLSY